MTAVMTRRVVLLAVFLAFAFGAVVIGRAPDRAVPERAPVTVEEDDPRWDCRTMGNRVCGPNAPVPVR